MVENSYLFSYRNPIKGIQRVIGYEYILSIGVTENK